MKLSKHDLKNKELYQSESRDMRTYKKPNFILLAYDTEDGWSDALFEIHKLKQEENREAKNEERHLILELFPWLETAFH